MPEHTVHLLFSPTLFYGEFILKRDAAVQRTSFVFASYMRPI